MYYSIFTDRARVTSSVWFPLKVSVVESFCSYGLWLVADEEVAKLCEACIISALTSVEAFPFAQGKQPNQGRLAWRTVDVLVWRKLSVNVFTRLQIYNGFTQFKVVQI